MDLFVKKCLTRFKSLILLVPEYSSIDNWVKKRITRERLISEAVRLMFVPVLHQIANKSFFLPWRSTHG